MSFEKNEIRIETESFMAYKKAIIELNSWSFRFLHSLNFLFDSKKTDSPNNAITIG